MPENEIILGDAYSLIKSLPDKSVDLIVTDPPYDIKGIHGSGIMKDRGGTFAQEISQASLDKGIDLSILDEFRRVMKKVNVYIWCNKEQIKPYLDWFFANVSGCNFEILVWAKENPIPFCSTHYLVDKEYCLYFWEPGAYVDIPFERGGTFFLSKTNVRDKKLYGHPTIKPQSIIETLIENSSAPGAVVLDPFIGSGTTAAAAKRLGRRYIGFEMNPKFHKIAIDRLNGVTQKELRSGYKQEKLF